ncbi:hypothetical protein ACVWXN_007023 [Bradyrhizobium sp. i1.4.4]
MSQPRDNRQDDLSSISGKDHQPSPYAGASGGGDRLRLPEGTLRFGLCLGPGQPPLRTRLVAGLFILKHMLSNAIRNCPHCVMKNCPRHRDYDLG